MTRSHQTWLLGTLALLSACGPAGVISGRVNVEGGSAANVTVFVFGPQSGATVTRDDGTFSIDALPDGAYVVRATVRGTEVEEQSVGTVVTQGKAAPEPQLTFRVANAKVTGKVVFADGSDAVGVTVTAVGEVTRAAVTTGGGAFSIEGLKSGPYLVTVEARDTREGRVSVGVAAAGSIDVGELRLTPVGRLTGTVTDQGMPTAGVTVAVPGTSVSALTNASGEFELTLVPTGAQTVVARVGTVPFVRVASQSVTVARGENTPVLFALAAEPPPTGTVTGVVTFRGPRSPRDITVSVDGAGVTATPQANGAYSLQVPVGEWDIVATASMHPKQVIGRVKMSPGQTTALPGAELSWYRPVWRANGTISSFNPSQTVDAHPWSFVTFTEVDPKLALINVQTGDFRVLAVGSFAGQKLSNKAKYAAWYSASTYFIYEIATGTTTAYPTSMTVASTPNVTQVEFSSDENVLFVVRSNVTLSRMPIASPASIVTYPSAGPAVAIQMQNVDRWFVRESTEARLVTPTADVPQIFTNITLLDVRPTAWAITDCSAGLNCTLRVLAPTAIAAATVTGVSPNSGGIGVFAGGALESRSDYPCYNLAGTSAFCVRSSDGSRYPLPALPSQFKLNEAGTRVIMAFNAGSGLGVREEAMPPSSGTSSVGTTATAWQVQWVSPTRGIAYETGGTTRTMHDWKASVLATDNDVGPQGVSISGPLVVFPKASSSRWQVFLGDKPTRVLPVATSRGATRVAARPFGGGETVTDYGSVSFDSNTSYLIDERTMNVRSSGLGRGLVGMRSANTELLMVERPSGVPAMLVFGSNAVLEIIDGTVADLDLVGATPVALGYLSLASDGRTLQLGTFVP